MKEHRGLAWNLAQLAGPSTVAPDWRLWHLGWGRRHCWALAFSSDFSNVEREKGGKKKRVSDEGCSPFTE